MQACHPGPGQLSDCQSLKRMCSFPGLEAYGEQLWKRRPSFTGLASEKLTMEEGVVSPAPPGGVVSFGMVVQLPCPGTPAPALLWISKAWKREGTDS